MKEGLVSCELWTKTESEVILISFKSFELGPCARLKYNSLKVYLKKIAVLEWDTNTSPAHFTVIFMSFRLMIFKILSSVTSSEIQVPYHNYCDRREICGITPAEYLNWHISFLVFCLS